MATTIRVNQTAQQNNVVVSDWRFLVRELKKIEPSVLANFKANAKEIGKPVESAVKSGIPIRRPMRGFEPKKEPGRLTWGGKMEVRTTQLKVDTRIRKRGKSIVSVWVMSPAVALLDMANSPRNDGKFTREYDYSRSPTGKRKHYINGQSRAMLDKLASSSGVKKRDPSRYAWPSAEGAMNRVVPFMYKLVERTSAIINAEIKMGSK